MGLFKVKGAEGWIEGSGCVKNTGKNGSSHG